MKTQEAHRLLPINEKEAYRKEFGNGKHLLPTMLEISYGC